MAHAFINRSKLVVSVLQFVISTDCLEERKDKLIRWQINGEMDTRPPGL